MQSDEFGGSKISPWRASRSCEHVLPPVQWGQAVCSPVRSTTGAARGTGQRSVGFVGQLVSCLRSAQGSPLTEVVSRGEGRHPAAIDYEE